MRGAVDEARGSITGSGFPCEREYVVDGPVVVDVLTVVSCEHSPVAVDEQLGRQPEMFLAAAQCTLECGGSAQRSHGCAPRTRCQPLPEVADGERSDAELRVEHALRV